jgi:predicted Zn-dependent peptidase
MPHEIYSFPNGFQIIYEKSNIGLPITSIQCICDLGSVYENDSMRGVSHFIEHMCFKGTKKIKQAKDLFREYDNMGVVSNAFTVKRYTNYNIKCNDESFAKSVSILSDMVLHSVFDKKEFTKELRVVIEENMNNSDRNDYEASDMSEKQIYSGTPYENPIDSIKYHIPGSLQYDDVVKTYKLYYHPNNLILSIVSNIPFKTIMKVVKQTYFVKNKSENADILTSSKMVIYKPPNPQYEIDYNIRNISSANVLYMIIAFRTCSQYSSDKYPLTLLKRIIGGFFSSRLFLLLREDNGLTYKSSVTIQNYEQVGDFTISILTDPQKLMKNGSKKGVLPIVIEMLNDLLQNGITSSELTLAKNYNQNHYKMGKQDIDGQAVYNSEYMLLYKGKEKFVSYNDLFDTHYKSITREQINSIIKKYFTKSKMNVSILGKRLPSLKIIKTECEKLCDYTING